MQALSKKDKIILALVICMGVLYLYYAFIIKPLVGNIQSTKTSIEEANNKITEINIAASSAIKNKKLLEDLNPKYEKSLVQLPKFPKEPEVAIQIKSFADKDNIFLTSLTFNKPVEVKLSGNPNPSETSDKIMALGISINASGTYDNIRKFISDLESNNRIASVEAATLTSNINANANAAAINGGLTLSLNGSFYYTQTKNNDTELKYDFNKGSYGKTDMFK